MSCIFCNIVAGTEPCHKIYEDEQFLAFLDIHPYVEGHTLVIPKQHYDWVWDVPCQSSDGTTVGRYMEVCQSLSNHFKTFSKVQNVYSFIFGTDVPHAHIHLVPDYNKDDIQHLFSAFVGRRKATLPIDVGRLLAQTLRVK